MNPSTTDDAAPATLLRAMSALQEVHTTAQVHCTELIRQRAALQALLDAPGREHVEAGELAAIAAQLDLVRDALFSEQSVGDGALPLDVAGDPATMAASLMAMVEQVTQRQSAVQLLLASCAERLGSCDVALA